jgi:ferredoxin
VGCGSCRRKCPWEAVLGKQKHKHLIEPTLCQECGTCWYTCPKCAVEDPEGYRREKGRPRPPKARIDRAACVGCQNCQLNCEQGAIHYLSSVLVGYCQVDQSRCVGCGSCLSYCASACIELVA